MKRIFQVLGAGALFGTSFFLGLLLTFPEDAAIERVRFEVQEQSDGALALDLTGLSPWWIGVKVENLRVAQFEPQGGGRAPTPIDLLKAPWARARVGLFSLIRRQPRVVGAIAVGAGEIGFDSVLHQGERGVWKPQVLTLKAASFPLEALPPISGVSVKGKGAFDLDVDLDAPDGLRKANGSASLLGTGIVLEKLIAPVGSMLNGFAMVVEFSEFDIGFDITEGRAKVSRGRIVTNLFELELSGEVSLAEDLTRSRLRLRAVVKLDPSLKAYEGFIGDARQSDGRFAWRVNGTVRAPSIQPEGSPARAVRPTPSARPPRDLAADGNEPPRSIAEDPPKFGEVDADIAARRAEERRRRREEAKAKLNMPNSPTLRPDAGRVMPRLPGAARPMPDDVDTMEEEEEDFRARDPEFDEDEE